MNCVWDITNSVAEGSMLIYLPTGRRELIVKALVDAFIKKKTLLGAFHGDCEISRSLLGWHSSSDNMLRCVSGVTRVQITEEDSLMQGNCVRSVSAVSARWWRYPACDDKCRHGDPCTAPCTVPPINHVSCRASNEGSRRFSQSRRRPLIGPSPGWKRLLALSQLRHY